MTLEALATIPGGYFIIARTIFSSKIWAKPPMYLKCWIWLLGQANYSDAVASEIKRGELITSYDTIIKAMGFYYRGQLEFPTQKEIRGILDWLKGRAMIEVTALRDCEAQAIWGRPSSPNRAYVGLLIHIVNFNIYQDSNFYRGRPSGRPSSEKGQVIINKNIKKENITCPRCKQELVVENDLYGDGCVYCQRALEARA